MQVQAVKITQAFQSPTNPRGKEGFSGPAFEDLVASIKEKGVLVPLIMRSAKGGKFEVIAGNRRLAAATKAGLKEVPAEVRELSDDEAKEVQIIENLQRADVHPLDESSAYRSLMEAAGYEIKDVAAKVGKSEAYVRQRLLLSNLSDKGQKAFRAGELLAGHAVLVARLSPDDQPKALEYALDEYDHPTVSDLEDWIEREFLHDLKIQPWVGNKEAEAALGAHLKGCATTGASLFGEIKQGSCTDQKCWKERSLKYIGFLKEKHPDALLVSSQYGKPEYPGALSESGYKGLDTKKKKQCAHAQEAIIVDGKGIGSIIPVCASKECKTHSPEISSSPYKASPKEVAKRKKEIAAEKAKHDKDTANMTAAVAKISWPLPEKQLDVILGLALRASSHDVRQQVAKRRALEVIEKKDSWGKHKDYQESIRLYAEGLKPQEKVGLLFELLVPGYSPHYNEGRASTFKKL